MLKRLLPVAALLLALAGCGSDPASDTGNPAAGRDLLTFTATTVDGQPFDGATLTGKPTVLWFWAPWCTTCLGQAPGVNETAARFKDTVHIVGVAGLDDAAAMPGFIAKANVGQLRHIADPEGTIWKRFGITQQSTFVILDRTGAVTFSGKLDGDQLSDRVAPLIT
jgi:thiol-disulfide isomerase/thioredoxin